MEKRDEKNWAEKVDPAKAEDAALLKDALAALEGFTPDVFGMADELFGTKENA